MNPPDDSILTPQIEALIEYTFANKRLAVEAMQMAGPQHVALINGNIRIIGNNKRLAVLGDAVLAKVLCAAWFKARDTRDKPLEVADWARVRRDILSNEGLARQGFALGLDVCVITNGGNERVSPNMMATAVEALFGAIYEDGGDDAAQSVMISLGLLQHDLL
ncbi:hypothetical protein NX059_010609 [Plenodomus lindquistii]|nr:hypothetical protein NX059_010609 [Plenodomus lindquistii]